MGMKRSPLGSDCTFSLFFNIKFIWIKIYLGLELLAEDSYRIKIEIIKGMFGIDNFGIN